MIIISCFSIVFATMHAHFLSGLGSRTIFPIHFGSLC